MKKIIFKKFMGFCLAIVMVVGCALSLTGCGKKPANELDGTKWIATYIVDSNGTPYTGDGEYKLEFAGETLTFSPGPDIYGYISGAGESYRYSLENGKLTISQGLGDTPTVESYSDKMIEIRTNAGVLFRYEPES